MAKTKPNFALMDQVLEVIKENKKNWDQTVWRSVKSVESIEAERKKAKPEDPANPVCGTAMCFAGWAVHLDKPRWVFSAKDLVEAALSGNPDDDTLQYEDYVIARRGEDVEAVVNGKDAVSVGSRAKNLLGLDSADYDRLVDGDNTLTVLRSLVKKFKKTYAVK